MVIKKQRVLVESGKHVSDGTDNATEQEYSYDENGNALMFAVATYVSVPNGITTQADIAKHLAAVLASITHTYEGVEFVARVWREEA